ncbi:murein hydrolase activator EnvC family protein [Microbacterium abyssi]|uniref:murein hydrolase activator EnvC family protein n=1 Tax=Microbacterium abyssi TaxID=2782166 RepID=UPI001E5821BB|nr:M23 family metallopeptidase [Microbacterium sp. A18JL241]
MPFTSVRRIGLRAILRGGLLMMLLVVQPAASAMLAERDDWPWPVAGPHDVVEPFRAPAHDYGPGHRGIDIAADAGTVVHAPADGVVAFRGVVVDRPLLTIDHGDGVVTTFEPLESDLSVGAVVHAGDVIGTVATGGHATVGTLHVGVRVNGVYVNPMLMFGDVPRAILLPCCDAVTLGGGPAGRSP